MILKKQLIEEIEQIPESKLAEIYDLIHYFRIGLTQEKPKITPKFGCAKGMFKMSDDFDEPLEDFKDYMP
jgi:hypothetical protein